MIAAVLALILTVSPTKAFAPATLQLIARFDRPVLGEVCFQAEAVSDNAGFLYRETCEGIDGRVKQIWWKHWPEGLYRVRAVYRGGAERIITQSQLVEIREAFPGSNH